MLSLMITTVWNEPESIAITGARPVVEEDPSEEVRETAEELDEF